VPVDLVLSDQSAAAVWGFALVRDPDVRHVTVPRDRSDVCLPDTLVHRRDLASEDVTVLEGVSLTTPLRTVSDLTRILPTPEGVALVDSALRSRRVSLAQLHRLAAQVRGRGAGRLGRAVALADARSESLLESGCRVILVEAGLRPLPQYEVRCRGRLVGRVDLAWPAVKLAVEVDGFAFHADRASYRRDRRRLNALELAGWRVLRFSWEDVMHDAAYVVASVTAALALASGPGRAA
jgi:G:T-mismatch repair DNA endonuclease (very short patch repair protein)